MDVQMMWTGTMEAKMHCKFVPPDYAKKSDDFMPLIQRNTHLSHA